ncbi:MAG: hypothetical protein MI861_25810, partial [Pirellulales bacterium]|nr:hypothetical protein [Pirellulales bacterium]
MNNKTDLLRSLPAVDEVLRLAEARIGLSQRPRTQLVQWIRNAVARCRQEILAGVPVDAPATLEAILNLVHRRAEQEDSHRLQRVINATGVLLHTNLGRAPLADRAVQQMTQAAGYGNVELDLVSGKRSKRGLRATRLLAQLAGAEDAVVVNNCAGALMLVLQAIAAGREVIVSRGQLVEIGGGFRLP